MPSAGSGICMSQMLSCSATHWRICWDITERRTGFHSERRHCPRMLRCFEGEVAVKYGKDKHKLLNCFANNFLVSKSCKVGLPGLLDSLLPCQRFRCSKQLLSLKVNRLNKPGRPDQGVCSLHDAQLQT